MLRLRLRVPMSPRSYASISGPGRRCTGPVAAAFGISSSRQVMSEGALKSPPTASRSPVEEAEVPRSHDGLIPRRSPELAVDRGRLRLDGMAGQGHLLGDLGERQVGGEHRQQAQLSSGQCRRSGGFWTAELGQLGAEHFGLADEGSEAGPLPEQLVDLPGERPGTCQVGQRDRGVSQFDSCLDGEVRQSVGSSCRCAEH